LIAKYRGPLGYSAALDNLGTAAAPLLAGFSFALIGLILDKADSLGEPNLALLLLVVAALTLVNAVQFAFIARQYYVPPGDYLSYVDIASRDGISEDTVKAWHLRWAAKHSAWCDRARHAYNYGVAVLLSGVAVALIPESGLWHMPPLRVAAFIVIVLGAAVEAFGAAEIPTWLRLEQQARRGRNERSRQARPSEGRRSG
jgi:hypothetical protein